MLLGATVAGRVCPFKVAVSVSNLLDPSARESYAREAIAEAVRDGLRGPRGGRYVAINEPHDFRSGQTDADFMANTTTIGARVTGQYVRPPR